MLITATNAIYGWNQSSRMNFTVRYTSPPEDTNRTLCFPLKNVGYFLEQPLNMHKCSSLHP